ncbi:MAG: amidase [Candidatus Hodarchaeales archaeon]|jgi:amidase
MNSFAFLSAYQLLKLFKNKKLLPSELIRHLFNRIKKFNPELNAFILLYKEQAFKKAKKYDKAYQNDESPLPLQGIPFSTKDTFSTAKIRTTAGSKNLQDYIPNEDALLLKYWQEAGMISLGKTNTPFEAMDVQTFNDIFGITNNPWNVDFSPGGSTGGGAVSVVTGMVPLALGSDFAGSIRIPAHFCGIYGFKPSENRISLIGHIPPLPKTQNRVHYIGTPGWLARSVKDIQLVLKASITQPFDDGSVHYKPYQESSLPSVDQIRLAYQFDDGTVPIAEEIKSLTLQFINTLKNAGISVNEDFPAEFLFSKVGKLHAKLMMSMFPTPLTQISLEEHFESLNAKNDYKIILAQFFKKYDAWIVPVCSTTAIPHNPSHNPILVDNKKVPYWRALIHYCRPFNLTGNPVIVLPIGYTFEGFPVGIQLIGKVGNDEELLALALTIEKYISPLKYPLQYI